MGVGEGIVVRMEGEGWNRIVIFGRLYYQVISPGATLRLNVYEAWPLRTILGDTFDESETLGLGRLVNCIIGFVLTWETVILAAFSGSIGSTSASSPLVG